MEGFREGVRRRDAQMLPYQIFFPAGILFYVIGSGYLLWSLFLIEMLLPALQESGVLIPVLFSVPEYAPVGLRTSFVLFFVSLFLWLAWVLPAIYVIIQGNVLWRFRNRPRSTATKLYTQIEAYGNGSRRVCSWCQEPQGDRTYHCNAGLVNTCLPWYDHYCVLYGCPIYLYNKKAWLLSMPMMLIHTWTLFGTLIWAWTIPEFHWVSKSFPMVGLMFGFSYIIIPQTYYQWRDCGFRSVNHEEYCIRIVISVERRFQAPFIEDAGIDEHNPWDLGLWENLRMSVGSWWTCFFFFIPAPDVTRWEEDHSESDWPVSERMKEIARQSGERRMERRLAESSGFELQPIEAAHLRWRSPTQSEEPGIS